MIYVFYSEKGILLPLTLQGSMYFTVKGSVNNIVTLDIAGIYVFYSEKGSVNNIVTLDIAGIYVFYSERVCK